MIDGKACVVEGACSSGGIVRVIEFAVHATGGIEAAGDADHTDGIEAVGVLQNFRFNG